MLERLETGKVGDVEEDRFDFFLGWLLMLCMVGGQGVVEWVKGVGISLESFEDIIIRDKRIERILTVPLV